MKILFSFFLSFCLCFIGDVRGTTHTNLEAQIVIQAEGGKIQPGAPVTLSATIRNIGEQANAPGDIQLQFQFPKPLDKQPGSLIFETEKQPLPSIEPGKEVVIIFTTQHQLPSLFDFIRHDWGMRQYQALVNVDNHVQIAGALSITFSAYYYQGPSQEIPVEVPAK